ncbi:MAG: 2-oxoglutarate dehydrogenase E1 component [Bacteroidetes bacterium]|jgi:2-oxoglutarate dehydrogenase E1 component|nr:2-oxoglutarate dehydrogenase E1 component [Bacteroidota bacterium]
MASFSFISNASADYIDQMYHSYKKAPDSVDADWRLFFDGFEFNKNGATADTVDLKKEFAVMAIIHGFRDRGHLLSTTNPIRERLDRHPHLDLADYGLSEADLDESFQAGKELGMKNASLKAIIEHLDHIYCENIGFEYAHINDRTQRMWLRDQIENRSKADDFSLSLETKKRILDKLNGAVVFEKFLHIKYIGQKRFSLEGGETAIAALDAAITAGASKNVKEVIIGMAHRGRLNVLANIMGKTYEQIFSEFEGTSVPDLSFGDGDVKYHMGFSSQVHTPTGQTVDLKLVPNPSHLESVDPVVQGFSRAKTDILYENDSQQVLPILIHGDAALAGQGVAYETAQMSKLPGYRTGGTFHFVINNQIGFTTDFDDARSSTYSTAAAKLTQSPVFHVNGDDPEAVVFVTQLALEFRQKFNTDVYVDMVCYRKHGHNEGDDPKFTQPNMYDIIKNHDDPREKYSQILVERGDVEAKLAEDLEKDFWATLQARLDEVKEEPLPYQYQAPEEAWRQLEKNPKSESFKSSPKTGIKESSVRLMADKFLNIEEQIKPLSKVKRLLKGKKKLIDKGQIDWALGELMAYGSILKEGRSVRMSGQDVKRGTFSHRHAVMHDQDKDESFIWLNHLQEEQAKFRIYNSLLSEFAVLGFEYGYSMATPDALVLWEAQFGDFANGAQVIIDQYITAAESKWRRQSGLVMLLPHGYEGQGPEHSSARLERFLNASAEFNITVANITSPANFFHALRRQLVRPFRKPLVVMSPKSLLRHPRCVSSMNQLTGNAHFQEIIDDEKFSTKKAKGKARRILMCSGKIYYDLLEYQEKNTIDDVAIIRIEQLYPWPEDQIAEVLKAYKKAERFWIQEEPENMGAWQFVFMRLHQENIKGVTRKASASPATGYKAAHDQQQEEILKQALGK